MCEKTTCWGAVEGAVSSMCWYASYREGRMRVDMEPSTTAKFLVPLVLTPARDQLLTAVNQHAPLCLLPCTFMPSACKGRHGMSALAHNDRAANTHHSFMHASCACYIIGVAGIPSIYARLTRAQTLHTQPAASSLLACDGVDQRTRGGNH